MKITINKYPDGIYYSVYENDSGEIQSARYDKNGNLEMTLYWDSRDPTPPARLTQTQMQDANVIDN